jgi:hypothetical protein
MTNSQSAQTRAQNGAAIRRQIKLPFKKSIEITVKSLKVRLMRNLITVVSLVLAVAFLNFMLVNNDLANGVLAGGGEAALERLAQAGFDVAEGAQRIGTSAKSRWADGALAAGMHGGDSQCPADERNRTLPGDRGDEMPGRT